MSHSRSRHRTHSRRTSSSSSCCSCSSNESECSKSCRRSYGSRKRDLARKSGSSNRHSQRTRRGTILHSLTKRVHRMVDEDKRKKSKSKQIPIENKIPPCGCPHNCGGELQELRDYVTRLLPLLPEGNNDNLQQLECFCDFPERLLLEAWTILGAQKLQELLTDDILAICARREKRDLKHQDANIGWPLPPFTSFDELQPNAQPTCGITELWRRSLTELRQLSTEQVKWILSGSPFVNSIELQWDESPKHSVKKNPDKDRSASTKDVHPADSTSQMCTELVHKESTELEMRARAIRSLMKAENKDDAG